MAKILVLGPYAKSIVSFRGELIRAFVQRGHEVVAVGPEGGFEAALQALGADYRQVPFARAGLSPWGDLFLLAKLVRVMRELQPDIVFSYAVKPVIYGSLAARIAGVVQSYCMITGLGFAFTEGKGQGRGILQGLIRLLYRLALKHSRAVFFQNPDDLELFRGRCLLPPGGKAVLVNGSGVDLDYFATAAPVRDPLSFLLIARLIRDKGIGEYVDAARLLKERYSGVSFNLVGFFDSNPAAISREEVDALVGEGIINYLGETDDVRPYLAAASVYVLPSYREGTPRSVLEAMAMGRPVITSDAPGCRETVQEDENGFLVPVRDATALAEAMEKFILAPGLVSEMGKCSRKIAEEKYDVHKVNRVILETINL